MSPPLESSGLLEGEHLGQFLLQKFIGGGGMGVVFRALDTTLNREVAVKVLSRDQSTDDETLRRFRNEAQIVPHASTTRISPACISWARTGACTTSSSSSSRA